MGAKTPCQTACPAPQLPRILMARDATTTTVISEKALCIIISNLARGVSGMASVVLKAVQVEGVRVLPGIPVQGGVDNGVSGH